MKLKYKNLIIAVASLLVIGCQPEEYSLDDASYTADDLIQGVSYTVVPDAEDPNTIHLTNLIEGVTPLWETPSGRSQAQSFDIELPFSGNYEITFGVMTQAGPVYGSPYSFTVSTNNFDLLSDEFWSYLAGGVGKTKKWVPVDRDYGVGQCFSPVMYCNPDDVFNNQTYVTDLSFEAFTPNFNPGFESWLIPADDPYMSSYMTFGLDESKGCVVEEFRNDANGGTMMNGKFSLNLSDKSHPTITFTDCYSLHNLGFDEVCSNYTLDVMIVELTPYMLQLATMRTNSEGPWWLIWNFVAEDVQNGSVTIPIEEEPIEATPVSELNVEDVETSIFKIVGDEATYQSTAVTYLINEEAPYDWLWWNGGSAAWENNGFVYNSTWAPAITSAFDEFALTLSISSDGKYKFSEEGSGVEGTFTIDGNKLTFSDTISFFEAAGASRTVALKTNELYVIKADNDNNEFYFAVEDGRDASKIVNQYLFVNLKQKAIGGGATGPTVLSVDNTKTKLGLEASNYFRIQIYNPWDAEQTADPAVNLDKLKLKKGQVMTISFTIAGFTFSQPAKASLCENVINSKWEPDCFDLEEAITVSDNGTYTIKLTNTTDSTIKWSDNTSALTITMQYTGYATGITLDADGNNDFSGITATIDSISIE